MELVDKNHQSCILRRRFEVLRNDGSLCDVRLVSTEGVEFLAHSLYLAVHSTYFLQEGTACKQKRGTPLTSYHIDIPANYLEVLLDYIYRGHVTISEDNVDKIKAFASKLQFEDILQAFEYKELCSAAAHINTGYKVQGNVYISDDTKIENVCSISNKEFKTKISYSSRHVESEGSMMPAKRNESTQSTHIYTTKDAKKRSADEVSANEPRARRRCLSIKVLDVDQTLNLPLRKSIRLSNLIKETSTDRSNHGHQDSVHLKISPFKIKNTKQTISNKVQSNPSYQDSFEFSKIELNSGKSRNVQPSMLKRQRCGKTHEYDSPEDSACTDDHDNLSGDETTNSCVTIVTKTIQDVSSIDDDAAQCLLSLSKSIIQAVEGTSGNVSFTPQSTHIDITNENVVDPTLPSNQTSPRRAQRSCCKSSDLKSSKHSKRSVGKSSRNSRKPKKCGPALCSKQGKVNMQIQSKMIHMKTSKPTMSRKQAVFHINMMQLFTAKLTKIYLIHHCMRWASLASGSVHSDAKCWQCCRCQKRFVSYSRWSLHFRGIHLAFMQKQVNKITKLKLQKTLQKTSQTIADKTGRKWKTDRASKPMQMACGKLRKMPGPRCGVSLEAMLSCVECGVMLASRASLKTHLLYYHNLDKQQVEQHRSLLVHCELPDCVFANIDVHKVERHVRESHTEVRLPCPDCHRSFVRNDVLQQHILRIHRNQTKFRCDRCNIYFKKSCDQKIHEQQLHGIDHRLEIFTCHVEGCDFKTIMSRYLKAHEKSKHSDNRIQCPHCATKLKTKLALQMHINALHLKKHSFLCEVCGTGFCDPWSLQRHIAFRHSTKREFSCTYCQYACNNRVQFMNHTYKQHSVRLQSDTREELICPSCGYKALSACRMKAHIRHTHADPNKFTCEVCGKGFKNGYYLRDHQAIHSNTTYQCPQCDYSPWSHTKLKKHVRTQHTFKGVRPYSCPYCNYACALSGNCRKHVANKHPGLEVRYGTDKNILTYMRKAEAELQTGKVKATPAKRLQQ